MKRILYVHNSADLYGASRSLIRLLGVLDRAEFDPVAMLPEEGPLASRLREMGVPVLIHRGLSVMDRARFRPARLPGFAAGFPLSVLTLYRAIKRHRIALVHTNTGVILSPGAAARLAGVPHVWHIRDWFQEFPALWKIHGFYMRLCSDRILAVSEAIAAQFPDRQKVRVVHNGFDTAEFPPVTAREKADAKTRWALGDVPVVGCVGRIKLVRKGQEILLRAAALLKARGISARWLVVGAPYPGNEPHLEALKDIARQGGIERDVVFAGELADPRPAYAAMDIFVLPSAQPEPFGGVVMEAMGMGLPVIATAIGGSVDQVADGETGYLVPPSDPEALANRLESLLATPDARDAMGAAGRRRLAEKFALTDMVANITGAYRALLGAR